MRDLMDGPALCPDCGDSERCGPCHCRGGRDYGEDGDAPSPERIDKLNWVVAYSVHVAVDGTTTHERFL